MNTDIRMPPFPWQEDHWQSFVRRLDDQRFSHANLLSGIDGCGLHEFAGAMAHYLLCKSPMNGRACGACRSCLLFAADSHPDFLTVSPEEGKQQIRVDQIREMSKLVDNTAHMQGWKVVLICPAEAMNDNAANALLKSLEEPPEQVAFILVTYQLARLRPTVRSRCSKWTFPLPARDQALAWMQAEHIEEPATLLDQAGGAPLRAKTWLEEGVLDKRERTKKALADHMDGRVSLPQLRKVVKAFGLESFILTLTALLEMRLLETRLAGRIAAVDLVSEKVLKARLYVLYDRIKHVRARYLEGFNLNEDLVIDELLSDWLHYTR